MVYEKKNRSLVFSGSRKIPTLESTVQWETRQASFPTGTVGPRVGIFLSLLNTNDGFYLSHMGKTCSGLQVHGGESRDFKTTMADTIENPVDSGKPFFDISLILVRLAWGLKQIPRKNNSNTRIMNHESMFGQRSG